MAAKCGVGAAAAAAVAAQARKQDWQKTDEHFAETEKHVESLASRAALNASGLSRPLLLRTSRQLFWWPQKDCGWEQELDGVCGFNGDFAFRGVCAPAENLE